MKYRITQIKFANGDIQYIVEYKSSWTPFSWQYVHSAGNSNTWYSEFYDNRLEALKAIDNHYLKMASITVVSKKIEYIIK